jgi:O-antigen ligase
VLLLVGVMLVERYPALAEVNRTIGVILVLLGLDAMRPLQRRWAPELTLAVAFIAWAALSGWFVAEYPDAVSAYVRLLVQTLALSWAVFIVSCRHRHPGFVFLGLFLCCLVLLGGLLVRGELDELRSIAQYRVSSLTSNPNFAGILCLYGLMSVAWVWYYKRRSLVVRGLLFASLPPIVYVLTMTGSRKAFIATLLFGASWLLVAGVPLLRERAPSLILAVVVVVMAFASVLPDSTLEARLGKAAENPDIETTRRRLYERAYDLFVENPVAGVGLGNFVTAAGMGLYAHSDYAEVLATTGAVGGVLYFSIYVVLLRRLARLGRGTKERGDLYYVGLYRAILFTALVLGAGAPNFLSPWHWSLMFGIVGHTCVMENATRAQPRAASPRVPVT